jgi:CRISPR-associated protein (TIGR03986 family)
MKLTSYAPSGGALPQQATNIPHQRLAVAPYGFVPLPESVVAVPADRVPGHSTFDPDTVTGYIDVEATTATPMYMRAMWTPAEFRTLQTEDSSGGGATLQKDKATHFAHERQPWVPAQSLRGMVRSVVSTVTSSKPEVGDRGPMGYRAIFVQSSLKAHYTEIFKASRNPQEVAPTVRAGVVVRDAHGNATVQPAGANGEFYRAQIDQVALFQKLPGLHATRVGISERNPARNTLVTVVAEGQGTLSGWLLCTDRPNRGPRSKNKQFVFPDPTGSELYPVPPAVEEELAAIMAASRAVDPAFEKKDLRDFILDGRRLRHGTPVFFSLDKTGTKVDFIGWTLMFRLPYRRKIPCDFLPRYQVPSGHVDLARAIFGWVSGREGSRRGRVRFSAGRFLEPPKTWQAFPPHVLSSPKPSWFSAYLAQPEAGQEKLRHYDSTDAIIAGTKRYLPGRPGDVTKNAVEAGQKELQESASQLTYMAPVDQGATFTFRIRFTNLDEVELGALLWALEPPSDVVHQIGMAKPLGFGALRLTASLRIEPRRGRAGRYGALLATDKSGAIAWRTAGNPEDPNVGAVTDKATYTAAFERAMESALNLTEGFKNAPRIRALLALMRASGYGPNQRRYMKIDLDVRGTKVNEFGDLPVLPPALETSEVPPREFLGDRPSGSQSRKPGSKPAPRREFRAPSPPPPNAAPAARMRGLVKRFRDRSGHISVPGHPDVYVNILDIVDRQPLRVGEEVEFTVVRDPRGLQARQVVRLN